MAKNKQCGHTLRDLRGVAINERIRTPGQLWINVSGEIKYESPKDDWVVG